MSEVFISYARDDRRYAQALARALEAEGLGVWWDRDIHPGKLFDEAIQGALDEARCVVVLWSRRSVASRWVRAEASDAVEREILVPVLLENVRLPLAFRLLHTVDLTDWEIDSPSGSLADLIAAVRRTLGDSQRAKTAAGPSASGVPRGRRMATSKVFVWLAILFAILLALVSVIYLNVQSRGGVIESEPPAPSSAIERSSSAAGT